MNRQERIDHVDKLHRCKRRGVQPDEARAKPACHRARLKADTLRQWRMFTKQAGQIAGIRLGLLKSVDHSC